MLFASVVVVVVIDRGDNFDFGNYTQLKTVQIGK